MVTIPFISRTCLSLYIILFSILTLDHVNAQTGTLRGHLYDQTTGQAISFANVILEDTDIRTVTDIDGFFNFPDIPVSAEVNANKPAIDAAIIPHVRILFFINRSFFNW